MKIFIVFLAFLIVFPMFLVYTADMNKYMQLQVKLKTLAEDCAEAGALTINEKTASINLEKAGFEANRILANSTAFPSGSVQILSDEVTKNGLGYKVTLLYECSDIFRLDFLNITGINASSEYEWK